MRALIDRANDSHFVLASQSPRRQEIFRSLGLDYSIRIKEIDESFPKYLKAGEIPSFLSKKKAEAHADSISDGEILITADTVVWIDDHVLNKPKDLKEAKEMLMEISGKKHFVYTAVCLTSITDQRTMVESTEVAFHHLTEAEIDFYLHNYSPLDKAGAYGIQEFIGYIGIKTIVGDFYNVVGFPVQRFWKELESFI